MGGQDHDRLQRRLELLEDAYAASSDPDERRQFRNERLDVHRQLDLASPTGGVGIAGPEATQPAPDPAQDAAGGIDTTAAALPPLGAYPDPWSENDQLRWWNGTRCARRAKGMWGPVLTDQQQTQRPPEGRVLTEGEQAAFGRTEPDQPPSGPPTRPGYYPDPFGSPYQRYFDGTRWDNGT